MLQEVLARKNNDYMKNIVNTIQAEQNAIIRNVEDKNLIVQGIAGSGKTSVALHRIAFLLYKIKNLTSDKVLIFAPNHIFSEYISNVLPELGEENTKETTFSDFLEAYIKEYKNIESFTSFETIGSVPATFVFSGCTWTLFISLLFSTLLIGSVLSFLDFFDFTINKITIIKTTTITPTPIRMLVIL